MEIEIPDKLQDQHSISLLEQVAAEAKPPVGPQGGRPPVARRQREQREKLRNGGEKVDRGWLLEQLLIVYNSRDCRASDKLRALELMAKVSGYDAEKDVDERQALADLMRDMTTTE